MWLILSTMLCVGFGDVFPKTDMGRFISLGAMYSGVIMIYISITLLKNTFKLNSGIFLFIQGEKRALKMFYSL